MSEALCQLCLKGEDVCFTARCGHEFHESCFEILEDERPNHCKKCEIQLFKSKKVESILQKAREQKISLYEELLVLFQEIEGYPKDHKFININKKALQKAVDLGLDINSLDFDSPVMTLIEIICKYDLIHKLKLLIDTGLNINKDEAMGKRIWYLALKNEAFSILEALKELGFDPKNVNGSLAVKFRLTKWLHENGFNLDWKDQDGSCLIHLACIEQNIKLVKFLLRHGADINRKDHGGFSPFHRFVRDGDYNCYHDYTLFMNELIDLGADMESENNEKATPFYTAIKTRKNSLINYFVDRKAVRTPKFEELGPVLIYLLDSCNDEHFSSIIKYFDIGARDILGQTCYHKVMSEEYKPEVMFSILARDDTAKENICSDDEENFHNRLKLAINPLTSIPPSNVNVQDLEGNTPLHILGYQKSSPNRKLKLEGLLKNGARLDIKNKNGDLAMACFFREKFKNK